jgi:uncharacterized lipoprotein YmbA
MNALRPDTRRRMLAVLLLATAAIGGCLGPGTTQSTRYYVLSPQAPEASVAGTPERIGIMPVRMPDYLERPELILREGPEIVPRPFSAWATPLDEALPQVLAQNLTRIEPRYEVAVFPWARSFVPLHRVRVQIERFEVEGGEAVLHARWRISGENGSTPGEFTQTRVNVPVAADDDRARVNALSSALAQLSVEVARALQRKGDAPH